MVCGTGKIKIYEERKMCLDKGLLEAVTGGKVEMKILQTVADGDDICDIVYSIKPPNSKP